MGASVQSLECWLKTSAEGVSKQNGSYSGSVGCSSFKGNWEVLETDAKKLDWLKI